MNTILEKIKNTRILAVIGIVCLILGTILHYFTFSLFGISRSISLINYWEGKIVIVLAVANLLFIFKDIVEKYIPSLFNTGIGKKISELNNSKYSLIPTILAVAFALYLHIHLNFNTKYMDYGLGFYVLWIGLICLVAYAILHRNDNKSNETQM